MATGNKNDCTACEIGWRRAGVPRATVDITVSGSMFRFGIIESSVSSR
jgi:hypothetical protein